jgi:hypothetical protein
MQAQSTGAHGAPVASIQLTREQRDAIYEEVENVMNAGGDLGVLFRRGPDQDDREWVLRFHRRLQAAIRLLDQVGWNRTGVRDSYALEIDADLVQFMCEMEGHALDALEDDRRDLDPADAEDLAVSCHLVDLDLAALSVARRAQAAYSEAVTR